LVGGIALRDPWAESVTWITRASANHRVIRALNRHVERVFNSDRKVIIGKAEAEAEAEERRMIERDSSL